MRKTNTKPKVLSQPLKPKHVPERSCIACREKKVKKELVRLVCYQNKVDVDLTGKKPGRGAYLCNTSECWETAFKKGKLDHALRTRISPENWQLLMGYKADLLVK